MVKRLIRVGLLGTVLAMGFLACGPGGPNPADLVIQGGRVATVDSEFSFVEAVAVRENKIVYVGDDQGAVAFTGPNTRVIQLSGELVTPGLVDAHCHPYNLGAPEEEVFDVRGAGSFSEVIERVAAKLATMEPGEWLIGSGWSEEDWPGRQIPLHDALSAVSPNNPIFLYRRGGNSAFVNAKALEISGITKETPDPYGGLIGRKANGEPSGFLVNMGNNLVKDHFPPPDHPDEFYKDIYKRAAALVNAAGLTGWHDAGNEPHQAEIYKQLVDEGALTVRVNMMLQNPRLADYQEMVEYFAENRVLNYGGQDMFQTRTVKVFFDGALGSRGAAFYEEYEDDPGNTGVFEIRPEHLYDVVRAGLETGMQVAPHAIGTRGNGVYLDQVERALAETPNEDHRFRSEHAQTVLPEDVQRFVELGVIPSMQPIHQMYDMEYAEERLGTERAKATAFPWRSFLDAGAIIPSGSDFTVVPHYPLWGFYSAVTRQDHDGSPVGGWFPEQRMTREEALKSYTTWPAYAAFLEDESGTLEVGKYADIVIWDKDILTVPASEILETKVLVTVVNGHVVYEGQEGASIDARSYRLGGIGAFAEMVGAGVKKLALSAALDPEEMDALVDDATRIARENGAEIYRETDFLVTDLFPAELTDGKHVLLISLAETRREYMELKAAKARLVEAGEYTGAARRHIAESFGALLSYSDEKIAALLDEGGGGG